MDKAADERKDAESQAYELLKALRDVDQEDISKIRNISLQFMQIPAHKIRDYELRTFLQDALLDYQTAADEAKEYEASAMALQFGWRLRLEVYQSQALSLGIKDPLKTPIQDIAAAIKQFNEREMVKLI